MTFERILSHFQVRKRGTGKAQCICPAHADREASLTLTDGNDRALIKCHAGCSTEEVVIAAGLKMSDLFYGDGLPKERWRVYIENREKRKIEAVYNYASINGDYAYTKVRLEGKKMLFGILSNERFAYGLNGKNKKTFNAVYGSISSIKRAIERKEPVFIPEGEKDVNTLVKKGYAAFSCGGANDWNKNVSELCKDADVIVLADNDDPGKKLASTVVRDLKGTAKSIKIIIPMPEVPKADITDYFEAGHTVEEFENLIRNVDDTEKICADVQQDQKRYSAYGRSTKECAENELRIREEIKAGLYNSNKNITLDAYFDEWEKSRRGTIKDSSIKINRSKYNNHIRPVLGKIKVQKIEKRAVVKLQQDLSKKLSASMTNGVIVLLKTVLNAAVDDEILMKNPAASVKPLRKDDRPKASETIHRALTREEQQAFMQEAKTEWLYEFFCFSLCTGMRLNEITALKWQDIDYINNVIRVNKTVSWKEGGGIEETLPKSDTSNRDIPMNDTIKKILQMQKTKISMVYGEIHARKMDSNIFIGSNGAKAIASSTVSSAIDNVLKRLRQQGIEIERFTHHAFRDTFATRYIEEGGNMQTLQKILGHSSLAMTADLYAHVLPNTKQQEMQQIENGFIGVAVL